MKVTVIKENESVICGGKIYACGESFETDDLIAESLVERGYVKIAGDAPEHEAELHTGLLDREQLEDMSYADLKRLASQMDISAKGNKTELIDRICAEEVKGEEVEAEDENPETDSGDLPNTNMPE